MHRRTTGCFTIVGKYVGIENSADTADAFKHPQGRARHQFFIDQINFLVPDRPDQIKTGFGLNDRRCGTIHGTDLRQVDIDLPGMGQNAFLAIVGRYWFPCAERRRRPH